MSMIARHSCLPALLVLLAGSASALAADGEPSPELEKEAIEIKSNNGLHRFSVEVADTTEEQHRGMMFRDRIDIHGGMLFIRQKDDDMKMWMKNTPLSLDMMFIDADGNIVYIAPNLTPESTNIISAHRRVRAVLELPAGTATHDHIQVGDRVVSPYFNEEL